jgi:hypothetical protein
MELFKTSLIDSREIVGYLLISISVPSSGGRKSFFFFQNRGDMKYSDSLKSVHIFPTKQFFYMYIYKKVMFDQISSVIHYCYNSTYDIFLCLRSHPTKVVCYGCCHSISANLNNRKLRYSQFRWNIVVFIL